MIKRAAKKPKNRIWGIVYIENRKATDEETLESEEGNWFIFGVEQPKKEWVENKLVEVTGKTYNMLQKLKGVMKKREM